MNVGRPREVRYRGKIVQSSIWKSPVGGPIAVRGVNLEGDDQADREVHGGPDKAVYAYALEDIRFWEDALSRPLGPGAFGENLTTTGIDWSLALIGDCWQVGSVVLQVSQPRAPCWKLGMRMDDPSFPKRFTHEGRPGAYLRILEEGALSDGDRLRLVRSPQLERSAGRSRVAEREGPRGRESNPPLRVSVGDVFRIFRRDRNEAEILLSVPELADDWKAWAREQADRQNRSR